MVRASNWLTFPSQFQCTVLSSSLLSAQPMPLGTLTTDHINSVSKEQNLRFTALRPTVSYRKQNPSLNCGLTSETVPQDACQQFANSVSSLPPADAERVGRDAGGVRVLEALIQGPASAKQKTRLLRALAGRWATLASEFSSSHLVEKCYAQSVSRST